jgi:glycosyltransferase involved in cell wall biosynthesis
MSFCQMSKQAGIDSPFISIIIPALNEEAVIGHCLRSIRRLNTEHFCCEIIVVDNGSDDNTTQISESYGATVLIKKGGTISSLRNYGAKASRGDILAFLDADCVVPKDWLERSLHYLKENSSVILGFRLSIPDGSNWVARCWDLLFVNRYSKGEVDWVPTGNMIMNRETFVSVGGFNEKLETNEDIDFCFRAKKHGCKIIASAETSVINLRPPESLTRIFKKELWHGKEAFSVFWADVFDGKSINLFKAKNSKVVSYSLFYLTCILFFLFSLILLFSGKTPSLLPIALICPLIVSFFLAIKYVMSTQKYGLIFGMTILLMTYGFSRALGLLLYNTLKK